MFRKDNYSMDMEKVICPCLDVSVGDIQQAIDNGAETLEEIQEATGGAGTICEECVDELQEVITKLLKER